MKKIAAIAGAFALCLVALSGRAWAQGSTSGGIKGVVTEAGSGDAMAGVTVVATSPALQGTQSEITDGQGIFQISNLPPGIYIVTFYYSDITVKRSNVVIALGKVTPVYQKIDTDKAGGEVIEMTEKAPAIDLGSTKQGVSITQDYTRNIPIPGRTFAAALESAAGAQGDLYGVSFSGSTSLENNYIVDGVNTTSLTYGTIGTALFNDFIQETEIITGGYNAEYGRATGGVVNVVTKSGSNEFHGTVFSHISPGQLGADRVQTPFEGSSVQATSNLAYDWDFGFDLGGPIVKDKVWFYVGFAPRFVKTDVTKFTQRETDCREILPDGTLSECNAEMYEDGTPDEDPESGFRIYEPLDEEALAQSATAYQFVSKVNFAVGPEHQGQVSLTGTPGSGETTSVAGDPAATRYDYTSLTTDVAAKWTSKFMNNDLQVDGVIGWHRDTFQADSIDDSANSLAQQNLYFGDLADWAMFGFESQKTLQGCTDSANRDDDPYPDIRNCPDRGIGYAIDGIGGIADEKEERFSGKVTSVYRLKAAGRHEIMGGLDLEDNHLTKARAFSGDVVYDIYVGYAETDVSRYIKLAPEGGGAGFDDICGYEDDEDGNPDLTQPVMCDYLGRSDVVGQTVNWAAFLRDSWSILPNLTLNVGVRYEEQRLRFAKHLQNTVDPLTGDDLGTNAMKLTNLWAPRVGAIYDWTKEGRSRIYANWGRFYESIPMDINDRSFGGETEYYEAYDHDAQCGVPDPKIGAPDGPSCLESGQEPAYGRFLFGTGVLVAPGIKPQFLDEVVLGAEYEVLEDLRVGLSFQNRRMGRVLEDVLTYGADTYILANPGEFDEGEEAELEAQINALEMDSPERLKLEDRLAMFQSIRIFDKPRRDYNALQLTAVKRFSRSFLLQGSYTYSKTAGNYPGLFSPDSGQNDPNITSQYDLIELLANRDGPLPHDRPHSIKFDGYYQFDFKEAGQLTTGVSLRGLSGSPKNALGRHSLYRRREAFLVPRGSLGRTAFETSADVHVGYGRQLAKGITAEVFADVFNVLNDQGEAGVDDEYTLSNANPVVGGEYEDLVYVKAQTATGAEPGTGDPVTRKVNFGNTSARYSPMRARIGLRLTF